MGDEKILLALLKCAVATCNMGLDHVANVRGNAVGPNSVHRCAQAGVLNGFQNVPKLTLADCRGNHVRGQPRLDVIQHLWPSHQVPLVRKILVLLGRRRLLLRDSVGRVPVRGTAQLL